MPTETFIKAIGKRVNSVAKVNMSKNKIAPIKENLLMENIMEKVSWNI